MDGAHRLGRVARYLSILSMVLGVIIILFCSLKFAGKHHSQRSFAAVFFWGGGSLQGFLYVPGHRGIVSLSHFDKWF